MLNLFGMDHGRLIAGAELSESAVEVCSIGTLARRIHRMPAPDVLILDEVHHVVSHSWMRVKQSPCRGEPLCVFAERPGSGRETPEEVDGELIEVTGAPKRGPFGMPIPALHRTRQETWAELEQIAQARGYKPGWCWHTARSQKPSIAMRTRP